MIILKDKTDKNKSIYECDRCKTEIGNNERYAIYVKRPEDKNMRKKWDLCERDYRALDRGIEKNK